MADGAAMFEVVKPGLLTSVQDLGRPGYYHLGLPISGAMDRFALIAANRLVGNPDGAAGLEAVFLGPVLKFACDTTIAVTGAVMAPKVDGVEQELWSAFEIKAGQELAFGTLKAGARIYIAIAGGVDVPEVHGSRSTYALGALGGFEGRPLKAGDQVKIGAASGAAKLGVSIPEEIRRIQPASGVVLRAMPGLYWHRITEESQGSFFEDSWKVAPEADRIGYRFRGGRSLDFVPRKQPFGAGSDPSNIVDSCYPYGSIQVPGGTEPIVLHRDAVSGGGYFMVGTVISADMDLIGQLQPHQPVRFESIDMDGALAARRDEKGRLEALGAFLSG
ncbi:biotin-dependent carboxyltransferase family protein [Jiella sp. MQZ9-1]|uniref:Biotin-dependent carboxyltransferase n=1 Tax=Jiella flava TaxID=2816857 RepID=A0A939JSM7_9HYPH|nr:biotin-dependent carboxyltransferase family protein [Jiella flava]MBO0663123.1 biotin-dependent carboxyltransferase [Jiella flava]MCD2471542.1 biotin-dependent carboxyltransferase family protein [Jiella flava]